MTARTTKAVKGRLMITTALAAIVAILPAGLAHAEKGGDGGGGGGGGQSRTLGTGQTGQRGPFADHGGGGAGEVGGDGAGDAFRAGGQGGQTAGADGGRGENGTTSGGGGGGGAHGGVGAGLPVATFTGGDGGDGGNATGSGNGGGGGAGGYGYVVTGTGNLGNLAADAYGGTGGNGGNGANGFSGGRGGDGGKGLVFSDAAGATFTIASGTTVSGGNGGTNGGPYAGAGGSGGTGLEGSNLNVTLAGTVSGGLNGIGSATANAFNFTGGTNTLSITSTGVITGGIRTDGDLDIAHDDATYTLSNVISGTGSISKSDTGTLTLTGANTYSGGTTISGGTLSVSADNNLGASSGTLTLGGGTLATTASFASARDITLLIGSGMDDINVAASTELALSGEISGGFGFAKTGEGTLVLSGDNTFLGFLNIREGVVNIRSDQALGGAFETAVRNGAALELEGNITTGETVVLFGDGVSSDGAIRNASGANTISGDLVLNADSRVNSEAGTLTLAGEINGETGGGSPLNADLALGGAGNGVVSGTFGSQIIELLKDGAGTWTLSGNNLHTGQTTIRAGALRAESDAALGSAAQGTLVQSGGALELAGGINITGEALTLNGTGVSNGGALRNISGNNAYGGDITVADARINSDADRLTLTGNIDGTGTVYFGGAGDGTFFGAFDNAIAVRKDGAGTWTFTGADKTINNFRISEGELIVDNSAVIQNGFQTIVGLGTTVSTLTINGPNASWTGARDFSVGAAGGQGRLEILGGGTLSTDSSNIGNGGPSSGSALVSGSGSSWTATDTFFHGLSTIADLTVADGGEVSANTFHIALNGGSQATTLVTGANSEISSSGDFTLGYGGQGSLTVAEGGNVSVAGGAGPLIIARDAGSEGTLNIGAAAGDAAAGVGTVSAGSIQFGAGDGEIVFNHTDAGYTFALDIDGDGEVRQIAGTTILTGANTYAGGTLISGGTLQIGNGGTTGSILGDVVNNSSLVFSRSDDLNYNGIISGNGSVTKVSAGTLRLLGANTYSGLTTVSDGALVVDGSIAGDANVSTGARLSGNGSVGGLVTIADGGTLEGSSGESLSMGSLSLSSGSSIDVALGAPSDTALFDVTGDLTLDGTVNATDAGGYGDGVYRLMSYGGNLTDNGLEVGSTPAGSSDVVVQTALANQVNLVVGGTPPPPPPPPPPAGPGPTPDPTPGPTPTPYIQFWDGSQTSANGAIDGGSGTWTLDQTNWTRADGNTNDEWDGGFAVFQGPAGTINIDNSNGAITIGGMQFANTGTTVEGDVLTLAGANGGTVIRVGDGTAAGASMTATISSVITGASELVKSDLGTLVLSGDNTYTRGTDIASGALSVSSDSNLGATSGALTLSGGTLATTASFDSARAVFLEASGGVDVAADTSLGLSGTVSGTGRLIKLGNGTLRLTGTNTYTGGTEITAGTLIGNTTSIRGDVANAGELVFDQDAAGAFANRISGTGSLVKSGDGILTLSGANSYTGGTRLQAGSLSISANNNLGGASSTLTFAGGTLITTGSFESERSVVLESDGKVSTDADTELALNGEVSGAGKLTKSGDGTLRLAGTNTYQGGTEIAGGILSISADENLGADAGALTFNGGTLATTASFESARSFALNADGNIDVAGDTELDLTSAIEGAGALIKLGDGSLRLSAANSYAGGTQVLAGTLIGNTTSLSGRITNEASLIFDQDEDGAFDGTLSGSGSLEKAGSGTVTLDGLHPFSGDTMISDGMLVVNGGSADEAGLGGTVTVSENGVLGGSGSVGDLVVNGTIKPGNSIGTLTVAGDASFGAGSVYEVEVDPASTASDLIAVSGSANIDSGASVRHIGLDGVYAPTSTYTILTADGGVNGTFGSVDTDFAFLDAALGYDANSVALTLTRNDIDLADVAQTMNQRAAAGSVESLGFGNALYGAILVQNEVSARASYDMVSGEVYASRKTALINDSRHTRDAASLRLRSQTAQPENGQGFTGWAHAFGGWGTVDGEGNTATMDNHTDGVLFGLDRTFASGWQAGIMGGVSHSGHDVDQRASSAKSDNVHLGVYGGKAWGMISLRGGADYSWHDISTSRRILSANLFDRARSGADATTSQVYGEIAYDMSTGVAQIEPFLNVAYVNIDLDGVSEVGGPSSLTVNGSSADSTLTTLGTRLSYPFAVAGVTGRLKGSIGWQHAFGDVRSFSTNRLSGGDAFTVEGVTLARDTGVVETGVDFDLSRSAKLGITYQGQFDDGSNQQSVNARVAFAF
ncbi:autotransporter-associated beta strand repeat-containing protein [Henriciella algicola]|uniref:Autotransporter domain-containing protein n=1 Tax=Henriciella algicola TaxID=1608422 RepID=A0A399RM35_9PROT|nr:autotransporter-associated beta strand repeat-containing protein [Henriciella algicola]RIJ31354.1 autotransporter domain-containing protein [Henriciella algicola]